MARPSYHSGFYAPTRGGVSMYPELWRGCVGAWSPSLGATGLVLRDQCGAGTHGTLTNMEPDTDWVPTGMEFDGSNDYVELGAINAQPPITISLWIDTASANKHVFGCQTTNNDGWRLHLNSSSSLRFRSQAANADFTGTIVGMTHWVTTFDGDTVEMFLNGASLGTVARTLSSFTYNGGTFRIAKTYSASNTYGGRLDDVRMYSRVLSPNEIRTLARRQNVAYERRRVFVFKGGEAAAGNRRRRILIGS